RPPICSEDLNRPAAGRMTGLALPAHEGNRLWNVQVRSSYPYTHLTKSFSTHSRGLAQGSWRAIQRRRVMIAAQLFLDERGGERGGAIPASPSTGTMTDPGANAPQTKGRPKPGGKPRKLIASERSRLANRSDCFGPKT